MGLFGQKKKEVIKIQNDSTDTQNQKASSSEEMLQRERVKKELELLRKELEDNAAILDTTVSRVDTLRNEYYTKSSELDLLNEELQRKRAEVRSVKAEYNHTKSEFDRLNTELASIRSEYNPRVLESIKQEIEKARSELTQLNYEREDTTISLGDLRSAIDSARSELVGLKSKLEKARSELELVNSQSNVTKKELVALRTEIGFIHSELSSLEQLDRISKITQVSGSLVAATERKCEGLKKEIAIYQEALARVKEENRKLNEMLPFSEDIQNILDAKSKLRSLQSQQELKKKELYQAKKELEFIQSELATLNFHSHTAPMEKTSQALTQQTKEVSQSYARFKQEILLQPVGPVPAGIMESLQARLGVQFEDLRFELAPKPLSLPMHTFDKPRNQFRSPQVINWIEENCGASDYDKILAICDADAYSGSLNFVLGEAQLGGKVAVVYLKMLRTDTKDSRVDEELFFQRAHKESVHELGHIFGLEHCSLRTCAMYFSNAIADTDFKIEQMCQSCTKEMLEQIAVLGNC
jgi:archaemetzincin